MAEPRSNRPWSRPSFGVCLALILLVGLAVRVGYVVTVTGDRTLIGDALSYHLWADQIAKGNGMVTVSHAQVGTTVTEPVASAQLAPLFPHFLGVVAWLGVTTVFAQKIVMAFVGTLTVMLIGLAGREAGGDRVGLVAAAIASVYPFLWVADGSLMSETLYGVWLAAILLVVFRYGRRATIPTALLLGALIGFAALTRGEALGLGPFVAAPLGWMGGATWGRRLALVGASALAAVLVLTPWTVRNLREFEEPVLIATNSNSVFVGANCDETYDGYHIGLWIFACRGSDPPGDESEQAAVYRERGLAYARENLDRLPRVVVVRSLRAWELYRPLQQARFEVYEGRPETVSRVGLVVYYPLFVAAIVGAFSIRGRRRLQVPLLGPVVVVCLVSAVVYGVTRFRFTAEPSLVVLGALGIEATIRWWSQRRRSRDLAYEPVDGASAEVDVTAATLADMDTGQQ